MIMIEVDHHLMFIGCEHSESTLSSAMSKICLLVIITVLVCVSISSKADP